MLDVLFAILITFLIVTATLGLFAYWKGRKREQIHSAAEFNLATQFAIKAVLVCAILVTAWVAYTILNGFSLQLSSAMFVGIPSLIALLIVLTRQYQRPYLTFFLSVTALLAFLLIASEGLICVLVAAPIYYGIGFLVILISRWAFKKSNGYTGKILLLLAISVLSLEGVVPIYQFNQQYTVTHSETIELPIAQVRSNLSQNPEFDALPTHLLGLIGLPVPIEANGEGLQTGDQREFVFQRKDGVKEIVVFKVATANEHSATLVPIQDNTVISRWVGWQKTEFEWSSVNTNSTRMQVAMTFERRVSPAWYFGPLQKLVVKQAERVLIEHGRQLLTTKANVNLATR